MFGDEIWDEDQWEAFLRENDRRIDRLMDLLFAFMAENAPPDRDDAEQQAAWENDLREYLLAHGIEHPNAFFPFLPSGGEEADDQDEPFSFEAPDDDLVDERDDPFGDFHDLPVYQQAFELSTDVLEWTNALPGALKDSTLVHLCSHLTQIPANVAKGHGIGYERDMLGGNIACAKRALAAANAALDLLREMRPAAYLDAATYRRFYEQAYEVRNALGLYVQDLRARFDLGID